MEESALDRFWAKVDKNGPVPRHVPELGQCWIWLAAKLRKGYGQFSHRGTVVRAHRFSYELSNGPLGEYLALHRCDNPACVNPDHLFPGTHQDNARDRDRKGRHVPAKGDRNGSRVKPERKPKGIRHGMAILTEQQAIEIRASSGSQRITAKRYGVSRELVSKIRNHKLWAYLDDQNGDNAGTV